MNEIIEALRFNYSLTAIDVTRNGVGAAALGLLEERLEHSGAVRSRPAIAG